MFFYVVLGKFFEDAAARRVDVHATVRGLDDADLHLVCFQVLAEHGLQRADGELDRLLQRRRGNATRVRGRRRGCRSCCSCRRRCRCRCRCGCLGWHEVGLQLLLKPVRCFHLLHASTRSVVASHVTRRINFVEQRPLLFVAPDDHCLDGHDAHVSMLGVDLVVVGEPPGHHVHRHVVAELEAEVGHLLPQLLRDASRVGGKTRHEDTHMGRNPVNV
mmetsp:Transcript_8931/g.22956  ORF Transcript_8931/g.22956 Transcript_8931/m.22956 type:complete len:217 (+) Transcript_8931:67-717(+)